LRPTRIRHEWHLDQFCHFCRVHCMPNTHTHRLQKKGSPHSITEHMFPELIAVLGSQPAGDMSHKPGGRMLLLSARPAVTLEGCYQFRCMVNRGTMGVNSLPKTVTRQRQGCDLNPGPTALESSTLTTRLYQATRDYRTCIELHVTFAVLPCMTRCEFIICCCWPVIGRAELPDCARIGS